MVLQSPSAPRSKIAYRPIEAAIRWSGLTRHEPLILESLGGRRLPEPQEFPDWPALRLNAERIADGIVNGELRVAIRGVTVADAIDVEDPELTIRHIELKAWMQRYYSEERPRFLFGEFKRRTSPLVSVRALQALSLERETLQLQLQQRETELKSLRQQLKTTHSESPAQDPLSARSETTYQHIIGGLLTLLVGPSPAGQPHSSFKSQEAVISALISNFGDRLGIAARTLQAKFAAARRSLGE